MNYLVPEVIRIVEECEGHQVPNEFKDDVDASLRQARLALEMFQRMPVSGVANLHAPGAVHPSPNELQFIFH